MRSNACSKKLRSIWEVASRCGGKADWWFPNRAGGHSWKTAQYRIVPLEGRQKQGNNYVNIPYTRMLLILRCVKKSRESSQHIGHSSFRRWRLQLPGLSVIGGRNQLSFFPQATRFIGQSRIRSQTRLSFLKIYFIRFIVFSKCVGIR